MIRPAALALALAALLALTGCGKVVPALLGAGGPNVAANVQAGRTNAQTIGKTAVTDQRIVRPTADRILQSADDNRLRAERVEHVVVNEVPVWIIIAALLGWLAPSPGEMGRLVLAPFRRRI